MSAVYSHRFFAAQNLSGSHTYTVPAGYAAVLRDCDAYIDGGLSIGGVTLRVLNAVGGTIFYAIAAPSTKINPSWRGRQVFTEGEDITWEATDGIDFTASGYLLTLP